MIAWRPCRHPARHPARLPARLLDCLPLCVCLSLVCVSASLSLCLSLSICLSASLSVSHTLSRLWAQMATERCWQVIGGEYRNMMMILVMMTGHLGKSCSTQANPYDNAKLTINSKPITERSAIFCSFHVIISSIFERHTVGFCATFGPFRANTLRHCLVALRPHLFASDSAAAPSFCACTDDSSHAPGRLLSSVPHGRTTTNNWRNTFRHHEEVCVLLQSPSNRVHRIIWDSAFSMGLLATYTTLRSILSCCARRWRPCEYPTASAPVRAGNDSGCEEAYLAWCRDERQDRGRRLRHTLDQFVIRTLPRELVSPLIAQHIACRAAVCEVVERAWWA